MDQEFEQQKQIKVFNWVEKNVMLNPCRNVLPISLMSFKLTTMLVLEVMVFPDNVVYVKMKFGICSFEEWKRNAELVLRCSFVR